MALTAADVLTLSNGYKLARAVAAAAELDLGTVLRAGPRSAAEVAGQAGTDPAATERLLQALASEGVLEEPEPGTFSLGDAGTALLPEADGGFRELMLGWPALDCVYDAYGCLAEGVRTGTPSFQVRFGTSFFEHLGSQPAVEERYERAVGGWDPSEYDGFLAAYDFSGHRRIVDLGGGRGGLARALSAALPTTEVCLVESATVAPGTQARLAEVGADRVDVVVADLRTDELPPADCYVMTTVLRYFDDEPAIDLLQRIRPRLVEGGRLVLSEMPLPDGRAASPGAIKSLTEWVLTGGRDRSVQQFRALFDAAGWELVEAREYEQPFWVLVAAPREG